MPQDALVEAAAAAMPRCPRCGGRGEPRRRAPSRLNPFLRTTPPPGQVTCDDCGLDFEHSVDAGGADSGKALWSTASTASTAAKAKDP